MSLDKRFWRKVAKAGPDDCWRWLAGTNGKRGYGQIRSSKKPFPHLLAHRVSYILNVGDIPMGMDVLHTCDHPWCVNPCHLFIGTHNDNMADCVKKNRQKKSQFTEVDKERMNDLRRHGLTITAIGKYFDVFRPLISLILSGHVSRFHAII